jgi:hypothetical protein
MPPRYATRLYTEAPGLKDAAFLSANIGILAILYTIVGAFVSYVFYYIFDEYDPAKNAGMEWETRSVAYQLYDIFVELALIGIMAFWVAFGIGHLPILPVHAEYQGYVDSYTVGMFFMYTIFVFMVGLDDKLVFVFNRVLGPFFDSFMPDEGSILDFSIRYSTPEERAAKKRKEEAAAKKTNKMDLLV